MEDPLERSLQWMGEHFRVDMNPNHRIGGWKLYYLYALERAGILTETPLLGNKDWYLDGARVLLAAQDKNGSWNKDSSGENATWQTCFAILFLKKATRPLIASVDR